MTKREAKELGLEVWEYLRDNPRIRRKNCMPPDLYGKIKDMYNKCPLCMVAAWHCGGCPLASYNIPGNYDCKLYADWYAAETEEGRVRVAGVIVDRIKAWEVEE